MPAYITEVVELNDSNPTVSTHVKSKSVSVLVRSGSATVSTGTLAQGLGHNQFSIAEGEVWSWSVNEAVDWVESATVTADPGSHVQVMWQHF